MVETTKMETATQWLKFSKVQDLYFVGKETVAFGMDCHILFFNVSDQTQMIYKANSELKGDGIQCMAGHKTLPIFAFAEKCYSPRIMVFTYPQFTLISELKEGLPCGYLNLFFSDMEYVISLGSFPNFPLTVWRWRTGEKLASEETGVCSPEQKLSCSLSSPTLVSQLDAVSRTLLIWEVNMCCKRCLLTKHNVDLPPTAEEPFCFIWAPEGILYVADGRGDVYAVEAENQQMKLTFPWPGDTGGNPCSMAWYKGGIVLSGPSSEVKHFKKTAGAWIEMWSYKPRRSILKFAACPIKDFLIGLTERLELLQYKPEPINGFIRLECYGTNFSDIEYINPMGNTIVTLSPEGNLLVWDLLTDRKLSGMHLNCPFSCMVSNPVMPYVALGRPDGAVDLIGLYRPQAPVLLKRIQLCHDELDQVLFSQDGTLMVVIARQVGTFFLVSYKPNSTTSVLSHSSNNSVLCDAALLEDPVGGLTLLLLVENKKCCRAGNKLLVYATDRKGRPMALRGSALLQEAYKHVHIDPHNQDMLYGIPHRSRQIHSLKFNLQDLTCQVVKTSATGHQLRQYDMRTTQHQLLTYGRDGLAVLHLPDADKTTTVLAVHHRSSGGIKRAVAGPMCQYVVTLGHDGTIVCSSVKAPIDVNAQKDLFMLMGSQDMADKFTVQTGPDTDMEKEEEEVQKTWMEIQEERKVAEEAVASVAEKHRINQDFAALRKKMVILLAKNYVNPPEEQLEIEKFDIDLESREERISEAQKERQEVQAYTLACIKAQDEQCNRMKKKYWDTVETKGRCLKAMLGIFDVENFALMPVDPTFMRQLQKVRAWRLLEMEMSQLSFQPWIPRTESDLEAFLWKGPTAGMEVKQTMSIRQLLIDEQQDDEEELEETEDPHALSGSTSHEFVQLDPTQQSGIEISTNLQIANEIVLLQDVIRRVQLYFNQQFDEVFVIKDRELKIMLERDQRLRYILSELKRTEIEITDPEWVPLEKPETIVTVADEEVGVPPYISASQQAILDEQAAEAEARRLAELADNFRELALIVMMDGVLEIRWEDEIKKDIPLPKCMTEKKPEDFNEEDLRAIKDYEDKVKFLMSERERYKRMLEQEYEKLSSTVVDSVNKFNQRLADLFSLRLRVESAIRQEELKIVRANLWCYSKILLARQETETREKIEECEDHLMVLEEDLHQLMGARGDFRSAYDSLLARDKTLEKNIKKDFSDVSQLVLDQLTKLYKKRPKFQQHAVKSVTMAYELSRCSVTGDKPIFLPAECLEFLKSLDTLDQLSNMPPNINEDMWTVLCKVRRIKVECEMKIRGYSLEVAEADATVALFHKNLQKENEHLKSLQDKTESIRQERLDLLHNTEIQIVLKQGLVEVPVTGKISDFEDAILINRSNVENINGVINQAGRRKLNAMHETTNFHRGIICKEWEHKKMRMEIEDLKEQLYSLEGMKVTKAIQMYLRRAAMGIPEDKGVMSIDQEIIQVREAYERKIQELNEQLRDLDSKIQRKVRANKILDNKITETNVDVNEQQLLRDLDFETKEAEAVHRRMCAIVKRSRLISKIQQQYNEILVLQTELELLRLRTYPTLKYKTLI